MSLLGVAQEGYQPEVLRLDTLAETAGPIKVVLASGELDVAGVVATSDGRPLAGWRVILSDPTYLSAGPEGVDEPLVAEGLITGSLPETRTDEAGAFAFRGLMHRFYEVLAWDPETLLCVRAPRILAGDRQASLLLGEHDTVKRYRGRVVAEDGEPVAGAEVQVALATYRLDDTSQGFLHERGPRVVTDAEGRFTLEQLSREGPFLLVGGSGVVPLTFTFPDVLPEDGVEIQVERSFELRFSDSSTGASADALQFRDAGGRLLSVTWPVPGGMRRSTRVALAEGMSSPIRVPRSASVLVMLREGQRLQSVPLSPEPCAAYHVERAEGVCDVRLATANAGS